MIDYKSVNGVPEWQDVAKEVEELGDKYGQAFSKKVLDKIEAHKKYAELQLTILKLMGNDVSRYVNSVNTTVDLQNKLFMLEEELLGRGENPLENKNYMQARELLGRELQFMHKHGLDRARFQMDVEKTKKKSNDDEVFVVEVEDD
jgi:hypothetical protein